jgi:hypothetical protein
MTTMLKIVPLVLYLLIGIVSLIMAFKSIFSRKFLPFHEEAYGKRWEDVENNLQHVLLALLRISGLGFLVVGLLLLSSQLVNYFRPGLFLTYGVPAFALLFCTGLFIFNFILFRRTMAKTPWKGSLFAMAVLILCMILSGIASYF